MIDKLDIQEIIVVEGKDDTTNLKKAVNADTIETNGSAISQNTLTKIELAEEKRGVIVFTDPDFAGERIRKIITHEIPTAKHAFLPLSEARPNHPGSVGVEHASTEAIQEALSHVATPKIDAKPEITQKMLLDAGLMGGPTAKQRRQLLGDILRIGYTNSKQLLIRLNMFQISQVDFQNAVSQIDR